MAVQPKKTFLNLEPAKQQSFLSRSFREFALHDYAQASISQIVNDLGIAKGSVYQYFAGKSDLYLFLVSLARQQRNVYLKPLYEKETDDYLEWFRALLWQEVKFAQAHPVQALLLDNVQKERFHPDLGNMAADYRRQAAEIHEVYLQDQVSRGTMRADLDPRVGAHLLHSLQVQLHNFLELQYGYSLRQVVLGETPPKLEDKKTVKKVLKKLVAYLGDGLHA